MREILTAALILLLCSCGAKDRIESKSGSSYDRSIAAANKAFAELECELEGKCSSTNVEVVGNDSYVRANKNADKAFDELDCSTNSENCSKKISEKDTEKVEKPSISEKSSPQQTFDKEKPSINGKYPFIDGYPIWVKDPFYNGFFGGVGSAKPQSRGGYNSQKRVAVGLAQAEIARNIKVLVDTEITSEKTYISSRVADYYNEKFEIISKHSSDEILSKPIVEDEWVDENGTLYVWVIIPKN